MKIVNELNELIREEVQIDSRVHSRIIGARGRSIRKIMEDYRVDIKFPRSDDADPNLVVISGNGENVVEAKDCLLNLEEQYVSTLCNCLKLIKICTKLMFILNICNV